jgi:hypothetical protein
LWNGHRHKKALNIYKAWPEPGQGWVECGIELPLPSLHLFCSCDISRWYSTLSHSRGRQTFRIDSKDTHV